MKQNEIMEALKKKLDMQNQLLLRKKKEVIEIRRRIKDTQNTIDNILQLDLPLEVKK